MSTTIVHEVVELQVLKQDPTPLTPTPLLATRLGTDPFQTTL